MSSNLSHLVTELSESQLRQYIDALAVFSEFHRIKQDSQQVRGGMIWREMNGKNYLIRTSTTGSQNSLGVQGDETQKIFDRFIERKAALQERLSIAKDTLAEHRRMNRALRVGNVPNDVIAILNALEKAGVSEHFQVIGTHALYAYQAAAGVFLASDVRATRDVDLLSDVRKHLSFFTTMAKNKDSLLGVLKKADKTFELIENKKETARNASGFEVDIVRRHNKEGDPHPLRMTDDEGDLWAVRIASGDKLTGAPRLEQMVVGINGEMARMRTIQPDWFVSVKNQISNSPTRDPLKKRKDALQAAVVEHLIEQYLPQYLHSKTTKAEKSNYPRRG